MRVKMNILKKVSQIIAITMVFCIILVGQSYATISCNISLAGSGIVTEGKQVTVQVRISNIKSSVGMVALGATLEYDKTKLNYVGMNAGSGTWSKPSYNANNGKLVVDSDGEKNDGTVFEIIFEAKKGATGEASITLKNISVGEINEEIKIADVTKNVTIQTENIEKPGDNNNNNNNNNQGGNIGNQGNNNNNGNNNQGSTNNGTSNNGGSPNHGGSSTNNKGNKPTTETNNTQNATSPEEEETPEENTELGPREDENYNNDIEDIDTNTEIDKNYEDVKLVEGKKTNPILMFALIALAIILIIVIVIVVLKARAKDKRTKKIGNG